MDHLFQTNSKYVLFYSLSFQIFLTNYRLVHKVERTTCTRRSIPRPIDGVLTDVVKECF